MKKIVVFSLTFLTLLFLSQSYLIAGAKVKKTTTITVTRLDPGGIPNSCPDKGSGCTITTTTTIEVDVEITKDNTTGQYTLISNVGELQGKVLRNGQEVTFDHIDRSLEFPDGSEIVIIESSNFPELVGHHISLTGISTNSEGQYIVTFTL